MKELNFADTIFDNCWLYTVNFIGYYVTLSENLEHHFIFSSHQKFYEYYYNSDDEFGFREFEGFSDKDCMMKKCYLARKKQLVRLTDEEFAKTEYGAEFLAAYNRFTNEELSRIDFVYFDGLVVMKNKPVISDVVIDCAFGIKLDESKFEIEAVYESDFKKVFE